MFLLFLTPPTVDPDEIGGLSGGFISSVEVVTDVDLRWVVVPLAVGLALLASAAVAGRRPG